ncbi:uncharacterized protein LOC125497691 [Beta vulgaris subsp. vulgaris]|uniref:uncharacterized protein LOC125497691 n=1 Tax=Beta vulgaris subsp. vulgaris TaxID=3555 RepID=UPI00203680F4|nr:uncharacterized protein LOC125497691 [Beta vulgaris subsp. vulgaris]
MVLVSRHRSISLSRRILLSIFKTLSAHYIPLHFALLSSQNQVKASVQRRIRQSIAEEYPGLEPILEDLLPKKSPLIIVKCQNHLNLVVVNIVPLFFNIRDGPYMPTLRLLHQCKLKFGN